MCVIIEQASRHWGVLTRAFAQTGQASVGNTQTRKAHRKPVKHPATLQASYLYMPTLRGGPSAKHP
eukprot:5279226-Pleurochrysis_carterae.AAC.1